MLSYNVCLMCVWYLFAEITNPPGCRVYLNVSIVTLLENPCARAAVGGNREGVRLAHGERIASVDEW